MIPFSDKNVGETFSGKDVGETFSGKYSAIYCTYNNNK